MPEEDKFADQLTGSYAGANGDDTLLPDFYEVYGVGHGKPVAIPETAALYAPAGGGEPELAIKEAWWGQVLGPATHARFPQLKMVNWFEWDKQEVEVKGRVDWTVTNTPAIREAFTSALPGWLRYGPSQSCTPGNRQTPGPKRRLSNWSGGAGLLLSGCRCVGPSGARAGRCEAGGVDCATTSTVMVLEVVAVVRSPPVTEILPDRGVAVTANAAPQALVQVP